MYMYLCIYVFMYIYKLQGNKAYIGYRISDFRGIVDI